MTVRNFNNVTTVGTLTGPAASSATALGVQNFTNFPTVPFTITLDRNTAVEEICLVTAVAGGTLTVTRGFDGSAAQAHAAGATVEHTAGALEYTEANTHVNATANVHGVAGAMVGTDGAQALFKKTLVSPVAQADATAGDALVAWVPPAAAARNLFRGMNTSGTDVITVDAVGNVLAHNVHATGTANVDGTLGVTGALTASGGLTVPTGKKATLTDAPATGTDAANKAYVDGKTWPTSALSDAASAATPNVAVKRDSAGRAQVASPAAAADIATKSYVDAHTPKYGRATVTFDGSGHGSIAHGLGAVPAAAFAQCSISDSGNSFDIRIYGRDATTLSMTLYQNNSPAAGSNVPVDWAVYP